MKSNLKKLLQENEESREQYKKLAGSLDLQVKRRTIELERSNEDLQQFAHVTSHDLKEPLRKIKTFSNRLDVELSEVLPEKGKFYLNRIHDAADRMSRMIEGVLSYAMLDDTGQSMESVDLNTVLDDISNDLELLLTQKKGKIIYRELPSLQGIPVLIYQLFYNLISNSLKFSQPGLPPEITVEGKPAKGRELNDPELDPDKNYVWIQVSDNGIGFKKNEAEKIFNIFHRLHGRDKYEGTGLGLSLCKKIVQRHEGKITAEGEEGKGARFNIILPA
jgi:light-regulated signal transduction histidine kinase (bacteriophytochrome)